jgi:hypothetical protein
MISFRIVALGDIPALPKLSSWRSDVFRIVGDIQHYQINEDSDLKDWMYSDNLISRLAPNRGTEDILLVLTNVPLERNWYVRRIGDNRAVMTMHEMREILNESNIPISNLVLRILYAYSLVFQRSGNQLQTTNEFSYAHDVTKGCLFDMTGWKGDIKYSCHRPILCTSCSQRLRDERVSEETIACVLKEIRGIRKDLYYRLADWVKEKPILAIAISSAAAVLLGAIGSIVASWIWSIWFPCPPPS